VNLDEGLAPRDVPAVFPSSHAEETRWLAARRELRGLRERTARGWLGAQLTPRGG
jgi:hypothetical protein